MTTTKYHVIGVDGISVTGPTIHRTVAERHAQRFNDNYPGHGRPYTIVKVDA